MTDSQFWQLVTLPTQDFDSEQACKYLTKQLEPLTDKEIEQFDTYFSKAMRRAFTWQLWGAAFVIAGCNTEYDFAEFRCWLIAQGQDVYDDALRDPNSLVNHTIRMQNGLPYPYIDEYDLVAGFVFEQRNNTELPYFPVTEQTPEGKRFKDKAKYLKQSYPSLFDKYWQN